MNRRHFIEAVAALGSLSGIAASCGNKGPIPGTIVGSAAHVGHLLRDNNFREPVGIIEKDVVIIGGGVSGLSAARALQQSGIPDFALLELEQHVGGNAASGSNAVSAFPWGAHYVPIPNNTLTDYLEFLKDCGVITGMDERGLPL